MKKKFLKISIIFLIIIFTIAALSAYFLKTLAKPENIKKYLLPVVSEYLGRQSSIDDITIGLFSGITLKGVSIKEDGNFGKGEFIKIESVVLNFSFLELLQRKLTLKNVFFKSPKIKIIRNAKGEFNYSEILNNLEGEKKGRKKSGATGKRKNKEEQPFIFSIEKILSKGGEIVFIDRSTNEKEKRYKLKDLFISLKGKLTEGQLNIALGGMILYGETEDSAFPIKIDGMADLQNRSYSFDIKLKDINPYSVIDAVIPERASDMKALKNVSADADFKFDSSNYNKEAFIEGAASFNASGEIIKIPLSLKINAPFDNPVSDLTIKLNKTSIITLISLLPQSIRKDINSVKIKRGVIAGEISYKGKSSNFVPSALKGSVSLDGFSAALPDYNNLPVDMTAEVSLGNGKINTKSAQLKIGNSSFSLKATTEIFEDTPSVPFKIEIDAGLIDIDEISASIPDSGNDASVGKKKLENVKNKKKQEQISDSSFGDSMDVFLILTGKKIKYSGLPVTDLKMSAKYIDGVVKVDNVSFGLGKGKVELSGVADLSNNNGKIKGSINAVDISVIDLKPLLFPDFSGKIEGDMALACDFSSRGIEIEKNMKTLKGKGNVRIKGLKLSGVEFLNKTASFLGADKLKTVVFKEVRSNYTIEDEEIKYRELKLDGKELKVTSNGNVAFEGKIKGTALLKISPYFSQMLSQGKTLSNFIRNKKGWISVPLKFSGTTKSPKIGLEQKAAQKQIIEKGKKVIQDELEKIFKGSEKKKGGRHKRKKKNGEKLGNTINEGLKKLKDIFSLPGK